MLLPCLSCKSYMQRHALIQMTAEDLICIASHIMLATATCKSHSGGNRVSSGEMCDNQCTGGWFDWVGAGAGLQWIELMEWSTGHPVAKLTGAVATAGR